MNLVQKSTSSIFNATILLLAFGCFYFSISHGIFAWLFPDELAASSSCSVHGVLGCTKHYYLHSTINRVSAALAVCSMAKGAALFSPYTGWAVLRLFFYTMLPLSISFLLKEMLIIPYKLGLAIACILTALTMFILSDDIFIMFGLDLAIYATATFTFFILVALLPKIIEDSKAFFWFCILFAANLTSHEIFLAISGFLIPIFAWYRYSLNCPNKQFSYIGLVTHAISDKKVRILLAIYFVSAGLTMFAPGVAMRQAIWPSSGTYLQGLQYMLLTLTDTAYLAIKSYMLLGIVFVLGVFFGLFAAEKVNLKFKALYVFMLLVPFIYIMTTGYLIGITPKLYVTSYAPELFKNYVSFLNDKILLAHGGLAVRQALFVYLCLMFNIFGVVFILAQKMTKHLPVIIFKNIIGYKMALLSIMIFLFVVHPDRSGGIQILSMLPKSYSTWIDEPLQDHRAGQDQTKLKQLSNLIYRRTIMVKHKPAQLGINIDKYFRANKNNIVSTVDLERLYDSITIGYRVTGEEPWRSQIFAMYNVTEAK